MHLTPCTSACSCRTFLTPAVQLSAIARKCLHAGTELLASVEQRATRLIGGLSPGGLHALLQGFAELAWEPGSEFLAASEAAALAGLSALAPQELAGLLIAYCRLGHQPGTQPVVDRVTLAHDHRDATEQNVREIDITSRTDWELCTYLVCLMIKPLRATNDWQRAGSST